MHLIFQNHKRITNLSLSLISTILAAFNLAPFIIETDKIEIGASWRQSTPPPAINASKAL